MKTHDGVITELAELPRSATLNAEALARILGRHKKTVSRSVRRGDLPQPFSMGGRHTWTVGAILDHFEAKQAEAIAHHEKRMLRLDSHRARLGSQSP
jgi:predicted DNA-binding transcriptional regulator AlpA